MMVSLGNFREQPLGTAISGFVLEQIRERRPSLMLGACAFVVICSLLLGGGTRGGFLSDAILEVLAVPALLIAFSSLIDLSKRKTAIKSDAHWALVLCAAIAILPLVQLVPLPPWLWTVLPGREEMTKVFALLGHGLPWMPISVSPSLTWLSFLSLLPPIAIFLAAIQLSYRERRTLVLVIIAVGVISAFVGLIQVAEGPNSPWRFFSFTNIDEAVGFFANRNHFAALIYAVLVFASVWAINLGFRMGSWSDVRSTEHLTIVAGTAIFAVFLVLLAAEAVARSRAGLALTIVGLLAVFALAFTDPRRTSGMSTSKLLWGAIILALLVSIQFALYRILDRFASDPLEDARIVFAHNTILAAKSFMPFGAGLGTFVPVYAMFEKPIDTLANVYANHAHDDFLESWLETGVMGIILFCLFAVWLGIQSVKPWRKPLANAGAFDCTLARAATVVIGLLLVHSVVDYPMRTEAIMAVFAVSCALLVAPCRIAEHGMRAALEPDRDAVRRKPALAAPTLTSAAWPAASSPPLEKPAVPVRGTEVPRPKSRQADVRWGEDIQWPDEWRNSQEGRTSAPGTAKSGPHDTAEPDESGASEFDQGNSSGPEIKD
jgi:O-antigen ligase